MIRDKDYWETMLKDLTPFEASAMIEAIDETITREEFRQAKRWELEDMVDQLDTSGLVELIEFLSERKEIVEALREAYRSDWCSEGKVALKACLQKRRQYMLALTTNNQPHATA